MCREEMIRQIMEALEGADNTTVEQMYWLLMENIG